MLKEIFKLIQNHAYENALDLIKKNLNQLSLEHPLRSTLISNQKICERRLLGPNNKINDSIRVGVVAHLDTTKGLYRDVETLMWATDKSSKIKLNVLQLNENLYRVNYFNLLHKNLQTSNGIATLEQWFESIDLIIIIEALNKSLVELIVSKGKKIIYIPNLEWACLNPSKNESSEWILLLKKYEENILILARTESIEKKLKEKGLNSVLIEWSIPDKVIYRHHSINNTSLRFLFNAGNYGFNDRRGLDIFLKSIELIESKSMSVEIVIKGNKPRSDLSNVKLKQGIKLFIDTNFYQNRQDIDKLYDAADVVMYPSRFEGLGLSLLEALHRGCFVLSTNGDPMNDLLPSYFPRINSDIVGDLRLATCYEPSFEHMAELMQNLINDPKIILPVNSNWYELRQRRFAKNLNSLIKAFY